jgi:hypothetical protein
MGTSLLGAVSGIVTTKASYAGDGGYEAVAQALRRPLGKPAEHTAVQQELVRCATLAANGHNTQPWKFGLSPVGISIRPDFSRRTPAVDPDDHHVWVSLGCATENLVLSAAALGWHADVNVGPQQVNVVFDTAPPVQSPLVAAIFQRQCTRADYDGQALPSAVLKELERAADRSGVRALLLTERAKVEGVLEYVTQANSAQMHDPVFVAELKHWIRFNDAEAVTTGDGLFTRTNGNPSLPSWLAGSLFSVFFRENSENDRCARQLRSSAGVAIFVGARSSPADWFEVGRAYERFALAATAVGVRTAFVNQPIEVAAVRSAFADWLGVGSQRPDLVVRFGRGPRMPYSLRRPVAQVIV